MTLKSRRFRAEREAEWQRLESLLGRFERGRGNELSDDDVVAIPLLYRSALSSLSAARAVSLDQNLIAYLESLCTRAYFCVYGTRSSVLDRITAFLRRDWSAAVQTLWRETIASAVLGLLGTLTAYMLVRGSPQWYYAFIPAGLAEGRDPQATTESLRKGLFDNQGAEGLAFFSSFLFTHNAEVSLLAFALGFACCLPTAFFVFYNGLMLGALFAIYAEHGLGIDFGGWVLIHGVTELYAITIAGAAGFRIGWALAFPGERDRLDALKEAGRIAATAMVGVVVMLFFAGLLEGFARQLISDTLIRYAIAVGSGAAWLAYFYRPWEKKT